MATDPLLLRLTEFEGDQVKFVAPVVLNVKFFPSQIMAEGVLTEITGLGTTTSATVVNEVQ